MRMKRYIGLILALVFALTGCGQSASVEEEQNAPAWQEQYDLGVRYLSEGNYEEAIIAFTAAIEIDPKQATAYVGRGNAYVGSGETEENLTTALVDYEKAIELDETNVEAYLGLTDVYIALGDLDTAIFTLEQGFDMTNDDIILKRLEQLRTEKESQFRNRLDFIEFSTMEEPHQNYIKDLVNAIIQEKNEAAWELLKEYPSWGTNYTAYGVIYTEYDKYRIQSSPYAGSWTGASIQIRQKDGIGYYCVSNHEIDDGGIYTQRIGVCQCENWNWNGNYTLYSEETLSDRQTNMTERGEMVNGLLDGTVHRTGTTTYLKDSYGTPTGTVNEIDFSVQYANGVPANGVKEGEIYGVFGIGYSMDDYENILWND